MDPLLQLLKRLSDQGVECIVIGGMAAIAHGSPTVTQDLDVCVQFTPENTRRIAVALRPLHPVIRGRPDRMPLPENIDQLKGLKILYLATDLGMVDLLGEVPDIGTFEQLKDKTIVLELGGFRCRVLDLDTLIASKRAANRVKDRLALLHLDAIRKIKWEEQGGA